ncbi:huntingtin-interacting protein 1 isoform X1 [Hippoglossus hippoglossus]|uniref:huntingtin-interacting protein 1 isoform X1 n=1 Tax=Hippoglossus hippoglossus TaxID=8267 RepID=UPI00148D6154|nr:huntingtin-interacting protein 1 isoform X1 [Hippoglossus hippoglossus]XP_035009946.1 huntingtin-interacting protein 1 isoform X1 [Hippoglossus stenolepis]
MDRVKSSMQQVPNAIPKVIRRTGGANSLELEKESFERGQAVSINKAINTQEVAVKEKHARTCILGTHHEKGAHTFWAAINRLPLSSNAVLCWKFCHVFHKLLRDGHPNVIKDSMRNKADLTDMSRMWGHLSEGYGKLCSIYLKLLITKMEFHIKNPRFPGNLQMSNRQLDEAGENDVNNFFQLTVEMFDYLECELNLFLSVFSSLDMSRSVSVTAAGQCRLAPLIQVILDSSHLYDYTVKLLFKLHSCLPADTLQGHRDRFQEQFKKLKSLFYRSSNLQYFKRLIQIPQLPENPPNFLRASALSEHISPVVVIPAESSSPESEHMVETDDLVDTDVPSLPVAVETKFDDLFGTSAAIDPFNFNSQNGMRKDDKDRLIEQLTREIQALKDELESFRVESGRLCQVLRGRVSELEAELAEQSHLRLQALGECEFLKAELDDLRRVREDTEKEQRSLTEIERKAQANEQRYTKLKEKYTELVQSHADLLRKNAEVTRQMTVAQTAQDEVDVVRKEMQEKVKAAQESADIQERDQLEQLQELQRELVSSRTELDSLKTTMVSSQQASGEVLSTQLTALQSEKAELVQSLSKVEVELAAQGEELERITSSLATERESGVKTAETLQNQLNEKETREQALESQLVAARWSSLQGAVEEAEKIIQDSLAQIHDPAHISCTSSADYLASRCQASLGCMDRLHSASEAFTADDTDVSELLRVVTQCGHLVGDTIVQGSATSHMVPVEQADALSQSVKACGAEALALLGQMKQRDSLAAADNSRLKAALEAILATAEKLRPRGLELQQGELGDLVEQEMSSTSAAVESAAARIEEMLNKSRAVDTGIKMEVNERILASCTELMQAIKELVVSSKNLQRDIVESGRGAASMKEFYAKNSRWTEGLISASKAVGWGATVMVDAADLVVQGKGKFEELMVCSHEIAASTAQLVAASKVKADKDSTNLHRLQHASRGVTQATAAVVASTKSGKSQIEEKDTMDFSSMTLTQIKRQEMDAQVLVLELETRLQKERERLGELRKKHYELAGVAEGWGEVEEGTG